MSIESAILNRFPEPIPGYKFKVYIQNICLGFAKVTNIEEAIETETIQEGGVNDRVYSLRSPWKQERTMVFERGVAGRGIATVLLSLRFTVGQRMPDDIVVTVSGRDDTISKIILIHGAVVKKWSCSDLDAMSSELLIERFEVAYETMEQCPITAGGMGAVGVDFL